MRSDDVPLRVDSPPFATQPNLRHGLDAGHAHKLAVRANPEVSEITWTSRPTVDGYEDPEIVETQVGPWSFRVNV